ncbi:bifunctional DNA-formamidopyrimidine glycosylase/DNA-(apurinic or apyrimidinic site) lyase [Actinopolyspora mortivallis]|uniref:bifunctional DNA-formamidopyrimidine glycosylase/DNA-(apurinic or apyrimidinic site) lyase n=1 Tax=Actinopolyspora mortivallis TaxID=33906 RepID=UPI0003A704AE|nr:bifunctional DNA-formamidopyrimidine glycosylase/DNA-(apurinic or apyrimidinic site) lyase [Actinopolyspora mortivallis]
MPELPEVEVIRSGLTGHVCGRTLSRVEVLHPRAVRRHRAGAEHFSAELDGRSVLDVRRRGKYLWFDLAEEPSTGGDHPGRPGSRARRAVLAHLGMSGQLLVQPRGAADERHLRVRFEFADGGPELRFVDQRTFGGLSLVDLLGTSEPPVPEPIGHIAADPLEPVFDRDGVVELVRSRRTGLKRALLDQTLVSGIGNIYADEALWRARLHWAQPTSTLSRESGRALLDAVGEVMSEALRAGGTSFDSLYVNVNGRSGYFSRSLAVYGRENEPCRRCGTAVRRDVFMKRSSYTCPRCQPLPAEPHW